MVLLFGSAVSGALGSGLLCSEKHLRTQERRSKGYLRNLKQVLLNIKLKNTLILHP